MNQKIVVRLFCLVAWAALWLSMPGMKALKALEAYKIHPRPLRDCLDSARQKTGDVLHPDYAMNPYYLRLDLDGDNKMDYVTILVDESGKVRQGLLVCSSEGKTTFYQGMTDRIVTGDGSHQRLSSDTDEPWGIVADAVLLSPADHPPRALHNHQVLRGQRGNDNGLREVLAGNSRRFELGYRFEK